MIKLLNNIRKKLIAEGITTHQAFAKACATAKTLINKWLSGTYIKYCIGEIVLVVVINKTKSCPVRDKLWVATCNKELNPRAFRYDIYNVPKGTLNQHQTYLLPR